MMGFDMGEPPDPLRGAGSSFPADEFTDLAFGGAGNLGSTAPSAFAAADFPSTGFSSGTGALGPLRSDEASRFARAFVQARGPDGFVRAEEGRQQLERTGLGDQMLQNIWNLSDLDRDGRLSLREFACAMCLAERARRGVELPVEVRPEQQERLAQELERYVTPTASMGFHDGVDAAKPARHDDYSTVDTLATDSRGAPLAESEFGTLGSRRGPEAGFRPPPRSGEVAAGASLGQLAAVFEAIARLDGGSELRRLSSEVLRERRELEVQLARRGEFEQQLRKSRGQLDELREERRRTEGEAAAARRRIAHLQDELGLVEREVRTAEEDLQLLRESSGLGQERRQMPPPYSSAEDERRDVISKVKAERELLQQSQKSIEELRSKLDGIFRQKLDAQMLQQSLLEKQRQAEQDRGLMLTAIEAERGKLSAMRAERIKLWEERSQLERELAELSQERWLSDAAVQPPRAAAAAAAPPEAQRPRGIRREEQPPPVVFSALPGEAGVTYRRSTGDSALRPEPLRELAREPVREPKADAKGVRNDVDEPPGGGGWSTFGEGAVALGARQRQGVGFGSN